MGRAFASKRSAGRGPGIAAALVELVPALQPVDLAPLPLGRAAGALVTAPGRRLFRRLRRRREILIQDAGDLRGTAALGKSDHLEHPHVAVERDGDDVAGTHRPARRIDASAVDADEAGVRQRRSGRARAHHARVPQPFVDALPIQDKTYPRSFRGTRDAREPGMHNPGYSINIDTGVIKLRLSLRSAGMTGRSPSSNRYRSLLPSSCAFRASSLANGEFGSGSLLLPDLVAARTGLSRHEHDDAARAAALGREFLLRRERILRVRGSAEQAGGGEEGGQQLLHRRARRQQRACERQWMQSKVVRRHGSRRMDSVREEGA